MTNEIDTKHDHISSICGKLHQSSDHVPLPTLSQLNTQDVDGAGTCIYQHHDASGKTSSW